MDYGLSTMKNAFPFISPVFSMYSLCIYLVFPLYFSKTRKEGGPGKWKDYARGNTRQEGENIRREDKGGGVSYQEERPARREDQAGGKIRQKGRPDR